MQTVLATGRDRGHGVMTILPTAFPVCKQRKASGTSQSGKLRAMIGVSLPDSSSACRMPIASCSLWVRGGHDPHGLLGRAASLAARHVSVRIASGVLPDRGLGGECCRHGLDGPVLVFGDGPTALPSEQVEEV